MTLLDSSPAMLDKAQQRLQRLPGEAQRRALERRWDDALTSFDARTEIGVLGVPGRADTVEELSELPTSRGESRKTHEDRRRPGAGALVFKRSAG
ncbi:hypothetical protein Raf01_78740 [Rugosimonospora africana]|uniref:Uncharacterized protein n=1 Tax=Rugosimonospora africana TaxID=556532 RepID=A0A8J3R0S6_9ACTN|nr:hypothetical protein Raf01_78740 [Rugosimonospora africana]